MPLLGLQGLLATAHLRVSCSAPGAFPPGAALVYSSTPGPSGAAFPRQGPKPRPAEAARQGSSRGPLPLTGGC